LTEAYTDFDDFEGEIDDLVLLGTAKSIWPSPYKHEVIAEIQSHSPNKRKQALTAKLGEVRLFSTKKRIQQDPRPSPSEPDNSHRSLSPLPLPEQDRLTVSPLSVIEQSSPLPPRSTFPMPSDSQLSTLGIQSDSMVGGVGDGESDGEDYDSGIINAGSLKKGIIRRAAEENMVSGRVRFMMKERTPEEKAKWNLTHNVVKLEFINMGPRNHLKKETID
jgi:hypothetical protein